MKAPLGNTEVRLYVLCHFCNSVFRYKDYSLINYYLKPEAAAEQLVLTNYGLSQLPTKMEFIQRLPVSKYPCHCCTQSYKGAKFAFQARVRRS